MPACELREQSAEHGSYGCGARRLHILVRRVECLVGRLYVGIAAEMAKLGGEARLDSPELLRAIAAKLPTCECAVDTALLEAYFERPVTDELQRSFDAMKAASALREANWAMVSRIYMSTSGIDYLPHARDHLARADRAWSVFQSRHGKPRLLQAGPRPD